MYQRPQTVRLGLRASGFDLLAAERAPAAVAHTLGGKNLDQVGAVRRDFTYVFVDLVGRELRIAQRPKRRQDSRARQHASIDRVAGRSVNRAADALHGGESGHERDIGVFQGVTEGRDLRIVARLVSSIGTEMPGDVDVRIDQAGQHRQIAQVVTGPTCRIDLLDFSVLNHDRDVVPNAALSIENRTGAQNDGLLLGDRQGRTK
jgi:hypothetical protein